MTAQSWLPPTALFDGALTMAVTSLVESWHSRWITGTGRCSVRLEASNPLDVVPAQGWRTECDGLRLMADARMRLRLSAAALRSQRAAKAPIDTDRALLDQLAGRIWCDLLASAADVFATKTRSDSLGTETLAASAPALLRFCIQGHGGTFGFLCVAAGPAATARKRLTKPSPDRPALASRQHAIASQRVRVGIRVGGCGIVVSDLQTLSKGDVLVLDRRLADPLEVVLDGQPYSRGAIGVHRKGSSLLLHSTRKHSGGAA